MEMSREDMYSKEATLINRSKRELANGEEKDPIYKMRLQCFTRGSTGILNLARSLKRKDQQGTKALPFEPFKEAVRSSFKDCSEDDIKKAFDKMDVNKQGTVNIDTFLDKLRPPLPTARQHIIQKAFEKVKTNAGDEIALSDLRRAYNVKDHPKYLSGDLTETEILSQFLAQFDGAGVGKGKISKDEFVNYYSTVSAAIDNDAYFDLMMRRAYKL